MALGGRGSFSKTLSGRLNAQNWPGRGVAGMAHVASNIQVPSSGTPLLGGAGLRPNLTPPMPRPNSGHIGTQGLMGSGALQSLSSFSRGGGYSFNQNQ